MPAKMIFQVRHMTPVSSRTAQPKTAMCPGIRAVSFDTMRGLTAKNIRPGTRFHSATGGGALLLAVMLCAACGGDGHSNKPEGGSAAQGTWRPAGNEGTITGKVNFEGAAPKLKPLSMEGDAVCAKKHSGPVYPETVVTNNNGTLRNVLVR